MNFVAPLALLIAVASAAPQNLQNYNYNPPNAGGQGVLGGAGALGAAAGGAAAPVSYQFAYDVNSYDAFSQKVNYGHAEQREGDVTRGQYFVLLPDTRLMRVSYYSDATGFHPTYTFEGTAQYPQAQPQQQVQVASQPQQFQAQPQQQFQAQPQQQFQAQPQQFQAVASTPQRPGSVYSTPVGKK